MEALADRSHPEHRAWKRRVGPDWDSDAFDMDAINTKLHALGESWRKRADVKASLRLVKQGEDDPFKNFPPSARVS